MILANCGQLGLDPEKLSLGEYFEAVDANNEAVGGGDKRPDLDRLRQFREARGRAH